MGSPLLCAEDSILMSYEKHVIFHDVVVVNLDSNALYTVCVICKMAYSDPSQAAFAASKTRSQSDSDLLNPAPDSNGVCQGGNIKRNTSMDDLSARGKRKNFLYKLVRPWKWRGRRKSKSKGEVEFDFYAAGSYFLVQTVSTQAAMTAARQLAY